ncbi:MAG: response regulator [Acidobacteriota bacterium]|nr:response regulator [Acidobacteriota bacterium]
MQVNSAVEVSPNVAGISLQEFAGPGPELSSDLRLDQGRRTGPQPHVLIIDNEAINRRVLKGMLKAAPYRIFECREASEAIELLESERIDVIVLDLMLPGMSGPDLCRWLKDNRKTRFIPLLMLTNVQGVENEIAGISSGADEFLTKPLHPAVVRTRIKAMLRNKSLIDSLEEAENILIGLAQAVEHRDKYTGSHCERLAAYSVRMGMALKLPEEDLTALRRGGFLHDIGKISTPDAILFKPASLTADEWEVMKSHTIKGEEICKQMKSLAPVLPIIRSHHEKMDGSGYPDGLVGEQIPLLARILQVVDIYDALTTARAYKPAFSQEEALRMMAGEVRRGWRDPMLVELFARTIRGDLNESGQDAMQMSLNNMRTHLLG